MTGPKGNREFCFPRDPQCSPRRNIEVDWKQNSLFPAGPVIKCFVYFSTQKEKKLRRNRLLRPAGSQICRAFKEHDLITCKSKFKLLFSKGVNEFCSPLGSNWVFTHDRWHVLLQLENEFPLGGITNNNTKSCEIPRIDYRRYMLNLQVWTGHHLFLLCFSGGLWILLLVFIKRNWYI